MSEDGVVVDVVFEGGLLYLELVNLGDRAALDVACSFKPPLIDAQGRDVGELRLFRRLAFLAPTRRIRTLLGASSEYAESVTVTVEYTQAGGDRRGSRITHDLGAFRELAYVV
ncbi:MAG TPA: hypothetical protein VNR59_09790 [Gaiellaceae bacterium]|nr:hypothetical protein [Gaiellaceae bacterium]HWJ45947.1 hypothetical protein [Gaiellaceae bacterium]